MEKHSESCLSQFERLVTRIIFLTSVNCSYSFIFKIYYQLSNGVINQQQSETKNSLNTTKGIDTYNRKDSAGIYLFKGNIITMCKISSVFIASLGQISQIALVLPLLALDRYMPYGDKSHKSLSIE